MNRVKWIYAKLNLAVALIFHFLFKKWFQKCGLTHFLMNYREDGIFPIKKESRNNFVFYGNCIQCGFCVTECEVTDLNFYRKFMSPSQVSFSYTRSLPEISFNKDFLAHCTSCRACEKVCPTAVPLNHIMEFIKHHGSSSERTKSA